jgi:hypothetical protein
MTGRNVVADRTSSIPAAIPQFHGRCTDAFVLALEGSRVIVMLDEEKNVTALIVFIVTLCFLIVRP